MPTFGRRHGASYSLGSDVDGHWSTTTLPSDSRSSVGAYNPSCCLLHHVPSERFSAGIVNQYCQITARTCRGGACGKGFPANSKTTSVSPRSNLCSVRTTMGSWRHELSDANHIFQSKRGWYGA